VPPLGTARPVPGLAGMNIPVHSWQSLRHSSASSKGTQEQERRFDSAKNSATAGIVSADAAVRVCGQHQEILASARMTVGFGRFPLAWE